MRVFRFFSNENITNEYKRIFNKDFINLLKLGNKIMFLTLTMIAKI